MTPRVFRLLLLAFWLLFAAYFLFHSITLAQIPAALRAPTQHQPTPAWQQWIGGLNFLVSIWNTVELFFFKRRARWIYIVVLAVGLVNSLGGPPMIEPPAAALWVLLQSMVAGALLVAMFFSPVASLFAPAQRDAA